VFPTQIGQALPTGASPLHARLLAAMYLSGAVLMLLAVIARAWHEVRVVTVILVVWTGMLGLVSILNLPAFDWSRDPTWFWFVAGLAFPLLALWLAWCQLGERTHPPGKPPRRPIRLILVVTGGVATLVGLAMLLAPARMATLWPWPVTVLLTQISSTPFLAYGIGNLYAATQPRVAEIRTVVLGTLVFAIGVLAGSALHLGLFSAGAPSTWVWFGGFALASAALIWIAVMGLRQRQSRRSPKKPDAEED
jgi:hypothetical protein